MMFLTFRQQCQAPKTCPKFSQRILTLIKLWTSLRIHQSSGTRARVGMEAHREVITTGEIEGNPIRWQGCGPGLDFCHNWFAAMSALNCEALIMNGYYPQILHNCRSSSVLTHLDHKYVCLFSCRVVLNLNLKYYPQNTRQWHNGGLKLYQWRTHMFQFC